MTTDSDVTRVSVIWFGYPNKLFPLKTIVSYRFKFYIWLFTTFYHNCYVCKFIKSIDYGYAVFMRLFDFGTVLH